MRGAVYFTCEGIPLEKPRGEWELKLSLSEVEESRFWLYTSRSPSTGILFRGRSLINERDRMGKKKESAHTGKRDPVPT